MRRFVRFQDGDNVRSSPDVWESETIHALREEFSQPVQHYRTIVDAELRAMWSWPCAFPLFTCLTAASISAS